MSYLTLEGSAFLYLSDCIQIYRVLVCEGIENVHRIHCFFASLLASENQIYPQRQTSRNEITFKGLSHNSHKLVRIFLSPRRQLHIINPLSVLSQSKIKVIQIQEHLWENVELWNQLSHITWRVGRIDPRLLITGKYSVSHVEFSRLERHCSICIRFQSDEEVADNS